MASINQSVNVEERLLLSSRDVSERVKQGDYILKRKKDAKRSHEWDQFRIVWDDNGEEVFGVACCTNCKNCYIRTRS